MPKGSSGPDLLNSADGTKETAGKDVRKRALDPNVTSTNFTLLVDYSYLTAKPNDFHDFPTKGGEAFLFD